MDITFVTASAATLDAELVSDVGALAALLRATVTEWPPVGGDWDRDAMAHFRAAVTSPAHDVRWGPFSVLLDGALVANAGCFGPPDESGEVEIGYSVCGFARRRGIAMAVVAELCGLATSLGCRSVRAHVAPDNVGSLRALSANGFMRVEPTPASAPPLNVVLRRSLG